MVGVGDVGFFGAGGTDLALETPLDFIEHQPGQNREVGEVVPTEQVQKIDANLEMAVDEEIFEDTQFEEEVDTGPMD